jgi:hypothetical protein
MKPGYVCGYEAPQLVANGQEQQAGQPNYYHKFDALPTAPSVPELLTARYVMSGLLVRDRGITGRKQRDIAAKELSLMFVRELHGKIENEMKVIPTSLNIDAVTYEVQFLIYTREEFEKAVRAETKRLLEKALA